jgi:Na+/melibiose symporter-like transporter
MGKPTPTPQGSGPPRRELMHRVYGRTDNMLDRGQQRVFRLFWFFLPDASIVRNPRFEQLLASRFFSDAGQQALSYGALIAVVRGGGSAFEAALVGVAALIPPAFLALWGGAVADQLSARVALAFAYTGQALLCFIVPIVFGTDLAWVLFLIFSVSLIGQVSSTKESAVVPLVASEVQLASAVSIVSLVSNIGTAFGTAFLAPILVRTLGQEAVFFISGVMLLLAASRIFDLPTDEPDGKLDWKKRPRVNVRATLRWLARERAVATMMFVAALAGSASIVVQTLGPKYVSDVLDVDAADAVYVFAPTSLGLLVALAMAPRLVRYLGERPIAILGFGITALVLLGLGLMDRIAGDFQAINPLRLLGEIGISQSEALQTAGFLAIFLGFGLALTQISVQTYINRRVPVPFQGRTFALQSMLKNNLTIIPLLTLGLLATAFGVEAVLIASPFFLLALAGGLVRLSYAFGGEPAPGGLDVLRTYWEESEEAIVMPDDLHDLASPNALSDPPVVADVPAAEDPHDPEHDRA